MAKKTHKTSINLGNNFLTPNVIGRNGLNIQECIAELVANSLDWRITKINPIETVKISIKFHDNYILLVDNGVGMTYSELDTAIDLAESGDDIRNKLDDETRKGMYGLGMKVAALSLGWKFTINTVSVNDPANECIFEFDSRKLQDKKSTYLKELTITEEDRIKNSPLAHYQSGTSILIEDLAKDTISVTAIGEVTPDQYVKRNTAKQGDLVCVSGDLGGAYIGLLFLEREKKIYLENPNIQPDLESESYVIGRLLRPEARKDIIEFFEKEKITPHSMMDISDGLSSEILHISNQSDLGCVIYEERLPIADEMKNAAYKFQIDPTACALSGGEDYELLFTIDQNDYDKIKLNEDISVIGYMTEREKGTNIITKGESTYPITAQGWNAFKKNQG